MARAAAGLPAGIRLSDHVSLGVIARTFPLDQVQQILAETGKASERDLPAHVIAYYAIALALYAGSTIGWCPSSTSRSGSRSRSIPGTRT
jgi:cytosine/adenosine deaminase-related metal-dependent hydrolase